MCSVTVTRLLTRSIGARVIAARRAPAKFHLDTMRSWLAMECIPSKRLDIAAGKDFKISFGIR